MAREIDEKVKELSEKLDQGLKALVNGDTYKEYLNTMSKFYRYSVNNSILINLQKKDATYVAGYGDWEKKFGRHVKKGEKGIKIFAPAPYKAAQLRDKTDPVTGQVILGTDGNPVKEKVEVIVPSFKVTTVFDVSQTEGKELPSLVRELQGTKEDYDRFVTAIHRYSPVPICFEKINSGANGFYSLTENRIVIKDGLSDIHSLKTMIHELSHSILHSRGNEQVEGKTREQKEVEAESIAYIVCQHYGIDTSDYSFGYIATWSANKEISELKESMVVIRSTAADIITGLDHELELIQEKEEAMALAAEIDEFVRDFDFYDYQDVVVCSAAMIDSITKDLQNGDIEYLDKWLEKALEYSPTEADAAKALELRDRVQAFAKPKLPNEVKDFTKKPAKHNSKH